MPPQEPQEPQQPATPQPEWEPQVLNIDQQIFQENVRVAGSVGLPNPSPLQRFFFWFSDHKPLGVGLIAIIVIVLVGGSSAAVYIGGKKSDDAHLAATETAQESSDEESAEDEAYQGEDIDYYTDDEVVPEDEDANQEPSTSSSSATPTSSASRSAASGSSRPITTISVPTASGIKLSATPSSLTASWYKLSGVATHKVQVAKSASFSGSKMVYSSTNKATVTGLSSNTTYYVRVQAVKQNKAGSWSGVKTIRTQKTPSTPIPYPSKVTGLQAANVSQTAVRLTWRKASNASQYSVVVATNSALTSNRVTRAATTGLSSTIDKLSPGVTYYFAVIANNARGNSQQSSVVGVKTLLATPRFASVKPQAKTVQATPLKVTGATQYRIELSTNKNMSSPVVVTSSGAMISRTVNSGTLYYLRIRATDGKLTSEWSTTTTVMTNVLNPTGLKLTNITKQGIKSSWNASKGAVGYEIRYSTKATMAGSKKITQATSTTRTITGLKPGTKHWVQVRSLGSGASGWSAAVSATTAK